MELFTIGFISVGLADLLDISLVALLFYRLYKALRNSAMLQVVLVVLGLFAAYRVVELMNMELMASLFGEFVQLGTLALVVIFSPELRRLVLGLTRNTLLDRVRTQLGSQVDENPVYNELIDAVIELAANYTGSIVVLSRESDLGNIAQSGDEFNADVSKRLLVSIFNPKSPLHDGAVIIKNGRIVAARAVLPVSDDPDLPPELGLRHRSALGITEITDAAAIVTSEESGKISVANEGRLKRNLSEEELRQFMRNLYAESEA